MKILTLFMLLFTPFFVLAVGDKNQVQNPIFEDGCVAEIPPGFELDECEEVPAPDQAGVRVFFCDQVLTVLCPDDEGD